MNTNLADPVTQTNPVQVVGPPEGRDYAPVGFIEVDTVTGIIWVKQTLPTYNTGWAQLASSPASGGTSVVIRNTVADMNAHPGGGQVLLCITLGNTSAFDGNGGVYIWNGTAWQKFI